MTHEGLIEGFSRRVLPGDGIHIDALVGGSGPPVLLLHGYPQTRMAWHAVAPVLARRFTVVVPDLRGYGRSDKPAGDAAHLLYSKRQMARDQLATMAALGFERFMVAGHDRGGRVAYRLALDAPHAVSRLAVIDILPTADVFEGGPDSAMKLFHWFLLAQPHPLPETLINGRSDEFLAWLFERWAGPGWRPHPAAWADALESFRDPATVHATCEDYRAGWAVDRQLDLADRGQRRIEAPVLALWGRDGAVGQGRPLDVWRPWCRHVVGQALPGGHFVPEESPAEAAAALAEFFAEPGAAG